MKETHQTFCRICEALCGLEVDVEADRITAVRPDSAHVATRGFACVKGLKQHRLYGSPDRLLHPLWRKNGELVRAQWDEVNADIGDRLRSLIDAHGPDAVGMYVGTAAGFGVLHPVFAQGFMTGLGSKSMYSSATQDCANKFAVAHHVYGFCFTQPFPDIDRTECLIIVGANPAISKWSFLQVPNPIGRLKSLEARGAKLWVVDPRRTETAKVAGEHVFIRPDTDLFFYLAFLNELIAVGGVDEALVDEHTTGFDEVRKFAESWTPERGAEVTRIPADTLRAMVRSYAEADGAALYSSTGVNMGSNGSLCFWLQEVINVVSGNVDRRGGTLVGRGVIDFPRFGKKNGVLTRPDRSRIGGFASVNDGFPGGTLADEILTEGPGQIRALFVTGGNPLLTMPNSARLARALESLELLVVLDILPTETATIATHVLPCTAPLERPDLPFVFPLMLGMQARPYLQATRRVVKPFGAQRDEATIYLDLARAAGAPLFGSWAFQWAMEAARALHSSKLSDEQPSIPQEALLSLLLRLTRQGSFEALLESAHGRLREDHAGGDFLGERVTTDDGRIHLAPPVLVAQAKARIEPTYARELQCGDGLKLITRRQVTTHNSWTHNLDGFVGGERATNYLYAHPDDLGRLGLTDGAIVDVESATATVRLPVRALADLMPGTVALPHGWGHQHAKGLSIASKTRGVNVNLLAADGPDSLERVSGMAHLTGIPVQVRLARGPHDPAHWSGLPESERPPAQGASWMRWSRR